MRHRQKGITFIGLVCILSMVAVIGYAGILLVPVYLNYMKIAKSMERVATEFKGDTPDPARMRQALERQFSIEDVNIVQIKDVEIKKDGDSVTMHVNYEQSVPYIANVSLTVNFDKTVSVE